MLIKTNLHLCNSRVIREPATLMIKERWVYARVILTSPMMPKCEVILPLQVFRYPHVYKSMGFDPERTGYSIEHSRWPLNAGFILAHEKVIPTVCP